MLDHPPLGMGRRCATQRRLGLHCYGRDDDPLWPFIFGTISSDQAPRRARASSLGEELCWPFNSDIARANNGHQVGLVPISALVDRCHHRACECCHACSWTDGPRDVLAANDRRAVVDRDYL